MESTLLAAGTTLMDAAQENTLLAFMAAKINSKPIHSRAEQNMHTDMFGNLDGTRLEASGATKGSRIRWLNGTTAEVELDLGWHYNRTTFRGLLPAINESRNDTGTYVFRVGFDILTGPVISELRRVASPAGQDPNHDSFKMGFQAVIDDVLRKFARIG